MSTSNTAARLDSPMNRPWIEGGSSKPSICFVGMANLPVLAREYNQHPIGGEQVQQTLLAKAFSRLGHRVTMVTADYGQAEGACWDEIVVHKAYSQGAGIPLLRFMHPRWTGAWAAMKRADADVYYVSCAGWLVGHAALFCRRYSKKFIFRIASDADCAPEMLLIRHWRDKKLYEYGLRRAGVVLAQSSRQQSLLVDNYQTKSELARMLVEGAKTARSFEERDLSVLWVNNLRWMKRPHLFYELADLLPELTFHVVGGAAPGEQEFYHDAKRQGETRPNVVFHGQKPYHDVSDIYGRARVYVATSAVEGFPNSYLQAWASGTPVVAYFDPDGVIAKEGLGFAVRSPEEMKEAVESLATDQSSWLAASMRCKAFMAREYSEQRVLEPYRRAVALCASERFGSSRGGEQELEG